MIGIYRVEVTAENGTCLYLRDCGNLESARRTVTECREEYPDANWITVNRRKNGRVTSMVSMTVFRGTTAQERRNAVCAEICGESALIAQTEGMPGCTGEGGAMSVTFTPEQQLRTLARNVLPILQAIVDGYAYDPGCSDLDNEQPIYLSGITMGDYRRASNLLYEVKKSV